MTFATATPNARLSQIEPIYLTYVTILDPRKPQISGEGRTHIRYIRIRHLVQIHFKQIF